MNQNQDARFLAGRAAIIDELEESIPGWVAARYQEQWHPRYVHFLTVIIDDAECMMGFKAVTDRADCVVGKGVSVQALFSRSAATFLLWEECGRVSFCMGADVGAGLILGCSGMVCGNTWQGWCACVYWLSSSGVAAALQTGVDGGCGTA